MTDGRRSQWFAMDSQFLHGTFGADMLDRFGPAGTTLFVGFLGACKKSTPEGQLTYTSDGDALIQMGVATIALVDNDGEEWTLAEFWTWTGKRKQTKKQARGRLIAVKSQSWGKWQQSRKQAESNAQKARSRAQNRPDNATTMQRNYDGDTSALCSPDNDSDNDNDRETSSSSVVTSKGAVDKPPVEDDDIFSQALGRAATTIARRLGTNPASYRPKILDDVFAHRPFAERIYSENLYCGQPLRASELAAVIVGEHLGESHGIRLERVA